MIAKTSHVAVLLKEVVLALKPRIGGVYVDGTFGSGGVSKALLETTNCKILGIDRDPIATGFAKSLSNLFPGKVDFLHGCFGDMISLVSSLGIDKVDGIALDLGISSMQIDNPERGFSFRCDGPLDMRMSNTGESAADIINRVSEKKLSEIIHNFGEERWSKKVAREIVSQRKTKPITTTIQLAQIVRKVVRKSKDGLDPATRTFQAFRIYVNRELDELRNGLNAAEQLLSPGGRLAVVSFHSLEDSVVKTMMRDRSGLRPRPSRFQPETLDTKQGPTFKIVENRPIKPSFEEISSNSRARSAKLRVAERTTVLKQQAYEWI